MCLVGYKDGSCLYTRDAEAKDNCLMDLRGWGGGGEDRGRGVNKVYSV